MRTLYECQAACLRVPLNRCEAVLFARRSGACYRKRDVNVARCSNDDDLDLYLRVDL